MTPPTPVRARSVGAILAVLVAIVSLSACEPNAATADFNMVNDLRSRHGLAAMNRSTELDVKALAQAQRMARRGRIYHSSNLAAGVSPGWSIIGENVAVAGSIGEAQTALENSPGHLANMVNPSFNEMGVGVVVSRGRVWVVQVFVGR